MSSANSTAYSPSIWSHVPEAVPIAVLLAGLLVAIVMIAHHLLAARAEKLRNASVDADDIQFQASSKQVPSKCPTAFSGFA